MESSNLVPLMLNTLEPFAAALALLSAYLMTKGRRSCWLYGGISSALYGVVFYRGGFPAQALLQLLFLALSVQGYTQWKESEEQFTTRDTPIELILLSILLPTPLLAIIQGKEFLDLYLAILSVSTTVFSIQRSVASWALWIGIDISLAGTFLASGFYSTALLYFLYCVISISGLKLWRERLRNHD